MCIAILKPKESEIKTDTLRECWDSNPHGAGFMYAKNNRVIVRKELKNFERFLKEYRKHEQIGGKMVIHFRIMTHGKLDYKNTHPHQVNKNTWLVHNGVILQHSHKNAKLSDTVKFCKMLAGLPVDFMQSKPTLRLISGYIDTDKIILMDTSGRTQIVNEEQGIWDDGIWYSNQSYEPINYAHYGSNRNWFDIQDDYIIDDCLLCQNSLQANEVQSGVCHHCNTRNDSRVCS